MDPSSLKKYRLARWFYFLIYKGASYRFVYQYVLAPIVVKKPVTVFKTSAVRPKIARLRQVWAARVRAFVEQKLWLFGTPTSNESLHATGRRRLFCTPEIVKLRNRKTRGRPCSEFAICPFCFARRARWLYRKLQRALFSDNDRRSLYLSCRVSRRFVSARNFAIDRVWSEQDRKFSVRKLRERLQAARRQYADERYQLVVGTLGTAWTVIVDPTDDGWYVETRQLLLTRGKPRGLFLKRSRSHTVAFVRCCATDKAAIQQVLQPFCAYPRGLLYGCEELAAAAMHGRRKLRLTRTTGCLVGKRPSSPTKEARSSDCAPVDLPV